MAPTAASEKISLEKAAMSVLFATTLGVLTLGIIPVQIIGPVTNIMRGENLSFHCCSSLNEVVFNRPNLTYSFQRLHGKHWE